MHSESGVLSGEAVDAFGELVRVVLKRQEDMVEEWSCATSFGLMYACVMYT